MCSSKSGFLAGVLSLLLASAGQAATTLPSTAFTRDWLRSTNSADALSRLGGSSVTNVSGAAANNTLLYMPAGNHTVYSVPMTNSAQAAVPTLAFRNLTNCTVYGYGTVINVTNFGVALYVKNCDGLTIEGLKIKGPANYMTLIRQSTNWNVGTEMAQAVILLHGTNNNITIRNCAFERIPNHTIAAALDSSSNSYTRALTVENCLFVDVGTTNGIVVTSPGNTNTIDGSCVVGEYLEGVMVRNNVARGQIVNFVELETTGNKDVMRDLGDVTGNYVTGLGYCAVMLSTKAASAAAAGTGFRVVNNYFEGDTNAGIHLQQASVPRGGVFGYVRIKNLQIEGNMFKNFRSFPGTQGPDTAIWLSCVHTYHWISNMVISGNVFDNCGAILDVRNSNAGRSTNGPVDGVQFVNNISRLTDVGMFACGYRWNISGNIFQGWGVSGQYKPCIWLFGGTNGTTESAVSDFVISRNTFFGRTLETDYPIFFNLFATNVSILDNTFSGLYDMTTPIVLGVNSNEVTVAHNGPGARVTMLADPGAGAALTLTLPGTYMYQSSTSLDAANEKINAPAAAQWPGATLSIVLKTDGTQVSNVLSGFGLDLFIRGTNSAKTWISDSGNWRLVNELVR